MRRLILALALALAPQAHAICILCSCNVDPDPLAFGAFAPLDNAPLNGAGNIRVACSGIAALDSISVRLNGGANGSVAQRRLRSGANLLDYNLYSDAARTQIWGDGGAYPPVQVSNTLGLLAWTSNTPVWGRIAPAPAAAPGGYSDTVTVTVEW